MGATTQVLLWAWILLDSGLCSVSLPEITDGKFIEECVREHNWARSSVTPRASNMLYMTWDEGLAITARAWARHCVFKHNIYLKDVRRVHPSFPSVGENIWMGSLSLFNVSRVVNRWVDEKVNYSYKDNTCSNVCGHYTQVVWESSYKVGCAAQLCGSNFNEAIFVCNYAEAGNINGGRPYEQGPSCTECKGSCVENLCHDKARDSQQSYNWTPDWDPALAATGSSYVAILIVRQIALILTFIIAYVVHYFYPDTFCYE